jgi:ribose-phosphate pyrophosphokinase
LEKTRIDDHNIVHKAKDLDVEGAIVAIVDDMISTGGTICKASEALHAQGAIEVHAACTHGLFTGGAISRLDQYVDGVHATNSLANPRSAISGGKALARGVRQMLGL